MHGVQYVQPIDSCPLPLVCFQTPLWHYIDVQFSTTSYIFILWKPSNICSRLLSDRSTKPIDSKCSLQTIQSGGVCIHATMVTILPAVDGLLAVLCLSSSIVHTTFRIMYELYNAKKKFASVLKLFDYIACVCVCLILQVSFVKERSLLKIIMKTCFSNKKKAAMNINPTCPAFRSTQKNGTSKSVNQNENKNLSIFHQKLHIFGELGPSR